MAAVYFSFTGLVMIAGGFMGFVKAKSVASLVAGLISGLLLLLSVALMARHVQGGLVLALIVCLALAGRFLPALLRGKMMPAAYVAPLSVLGALLAGWLLMSGVGHPV